MKEDILEQLVDDYLQAKGYFTQHNLKFKPLAGSVGYDGNQDRVPSDIDVIGINPHLDPPEDIWVVGCKSWQDGFSIRQMLDAIDHEKKVGAIFASLLATNGLVPLWRLLRLRPAAGVSLTLPP
jgi:hypothetical protein